MRNKLYMHILRLWHDMVDTGLKTVVKEIPPESKLAVTACNKLAPKILEQLKTVSIVLAIFFSCELY